LDALELSSSFDEDFRFESEDIVVAVELKGISPIEKIAISVNNHGVTTSWE
jgi:hypothetical protein